MKKSVFEFDSLKEQTMKNTIGSFKLVRVLIIAMLVIPLAMGTVSPALADVETAPTGWQPVGAPGFWATNVFDTKLALDTSGTPYVAFRSYDQAANGYKATVMRNNGTAWEVVGTPGFSAGGTQDPSLALDGAGTPYLAYSDYSYSSKVTVMRYNGTEWQPVGAPGFFGLGCIYAQPGPGCNGYALCSIRRRGERDQGDRDALQRYSLGAGGYPWLFG